MTNYFNTFKITGFVIVALLIHVDLFAQAPVISSFSPTTVCQGDVVTITGTGFTNVKSVKIGTDTASKYTVVNATTITATVSVKAASGAVVVTTNAGKDSTTDKLTINPLPIPDLNDVSNPAGPFTNCNGEATYTLTVGNKTTWISKATITKPVILKVLK